jgi:eukaryotic-like serine/threonine-protein kinase
VQSAPTSLAPGQRFDRYELLAPLGRGGMGVVWLARLGGARDFEKLVALKTLTPELAADPVWQSSLLDEARICARIDDANVVNILDLGEQGGVLFVAMDWVDGDSLHQIDRALVARGLKWPPGVALRIVADACSGLHAAHELRDVATGTPFGVIHRDISPQNILVSTAGITKIIDFGIAKAQGRSSVSTSSGSIKGKLRFMAPEQPLGIQIDRRADVWSLGAVLRVLLTGEAPYDAASDVGILAKLVAKEAPRALPAGMPAALRGILDRALAPDAADRFATAAEMQSAIEAAMRPLGAATTVKDVAEFVSKNAGELAVRRKAQVSAALQAARERTTSLAPTPWTGPELDSLLAGMGETAVETVAEPVVPPASAGATPSAHALPKPVVAERAEAQGTPRRRLAVIALVAGLVVGVAGSLWIVRWRGEQPARTSAAPPAVVVPSAPVVAVAPASSPGASASAASPAIPPPSASVQAASAPASTRRPTAPRPPVPKPTTGPTTPQFGF